jgi:hypothetical protein
MQPHWTKEVLLVRGGVCRTGVGRRGRGYVLQTLLVRLSAGSRTPVAPVGRRAMHNSRMTLLFLLQPHCNLRPRVLLVKSAASPSITASQIAAVPYCECMQDMDCSREFALTKVFDNMISCWQQLTALVLFLVGGNSFLLRKA